MGMLRVTAATRQNLISKSKSTTKGQQRFYRRLFSKISIPNWSIQQVNVAKWFETDILDAHISVTGETDNYIVAVTFWGVWDSYDKKKPLSVQSIKDAIMMAYRSEDVYIACSCPDWKYRYAYVATQGRYIAEKPEYRPASKTNPKDSLGSACKHVLLCLMQSHLWVDQLSRATYKYVQRIKASQPRLYERFIKDKIEDDKIEEVEETVSPTEDEQALEEQENIVDGFGYQSSIRPINSYPVAAAQMPVQAMATKGKDSVQRFLALEPVDIVLNDGRVITAQWDKFGAEKNAYTQGQSTTKGQRFKIRNIEKLPTYISFAKHVDTRKETSKVGKAHQGVKYWYYAKVGIETDKGDFDLLINIRDNGNEQFFYEIAIT